MGIGTKGPFPAWDLSSLSMWVSILIITGICYLSAITSELKGCKTLPCHPLPPSTLSTPHPHSSFHPGDSLKRKISICISGSGHSCWFLLCPYLRFWYSDTRILVCPSVIFLISTLSCCELSFFGNTDKGACFYKTSFIPLVVLEVGQAWFKCKKYIY